MTSRRSMSLAWLHAALAFSYAGCYGGDATLTNANDTPEKKPHATPPAESYATTATSVVAKATYGLSITTKSGAQPCTGHLQLQIGSDFSVTFPAATVACLSLTIDIGKLLSGQKAALGGTLSPASLVSDGKVLSLKSLGSATFTPPRPFLLGPVVQDPESYAGFTRQTAVTMTVASDTGGAPLVTNGTFLTSVLEVNHCYANAAIAAKGGFSHVLHWQMQADGFKGASASSGLTFKNWEWYWNTRPIMIPKMVITVESLADFISSGDISTTSQLLGELTIALTVEDYDTPADPCPA